MAIFHLSIKSISRSTGDSAVKRAAEVTGVNLRETRRNLLFKGDKGKSNYIEFYKTLVPKHAPVWMQELTIWDYLESFEDQYALKFYKKLETQNKYLMSARVAFMIKASLPLELSFTVWQELVIDFVEEYLLTHNLIVTLGITNIEHNPHVNFLISLRRLNQEGTFYTKERDIRTPAGIRKIREAWAEKTNFYLKREGSDERVTHLSYRKQGINLGPLFHEGRLVRILNEKIEKSCITQKNELIKNRNIEKALANPLIILEDLSIMYETFSSQDLLKHIQRYLGDKHPQVQDIYHTLLQQSKEAETKSNKKIRYVYSKDLT